MPTMAPALTKSDQERSLWCISEKYLATARIRISLTHSEGWKCCPPGIFTQRRAPRYFWPKIITNMSEVMEAMYIQCT